MGQAEISRGVHTSTWQGFLIKPSNPPASVQGAFAEHRLGIAEAGVRPRRKHPSVARGWGAGRGWQSTGVHTCFGELSQASVGKSQGSCGAGPRGCPVPRQGALELGLNATDPTATGANEAQQWALRWSRAW